MARFFPRRSHVVRAVREFFMGVFTIALLWVSSIFLQIAVSTGDDWGYFNTLTGLSVVAMVIIFWGIYCLWAPDTEHPEARPALVTIGEVFADFDAPDDVEEEGDVDLIVQPGVKRVSIRAKRKIHYAARVALLAKAQVGQLSYGKANELVYQRICRDEMVKHGVRPSHIAKMLPLSVAACWVMTEEELLADAITDLPEVMDCEAAPTSC